MAESKTIHSRCGEVAKRAKCRRVNEIVFRFQFAVWPTCVRDDVSGGGWMGRVREIKNWNWRLAARLGWIGSWSQTKQKNKNCWKLHLPFCQNQIFRYGFFVAVCFHSELGRKDNLVRKTHEYNQHQVNDNKCAGWRIGYSNKIWKCDVGFLR